METLLLQLFSALVGAVIVYVFGIRKLSIELRNTFIQKQMSEFYSPIAGYRKQIATKVELRSKIAGAASEAWKELCTPFSETKRPMLDHEELYKPFGKIIDYDNAQLREEMMPLYRKILDTFTLHYWLADEETKAYYQDFVEYVEIWERFLADSLPIEVLKKLDHSEQKVFPFYEHIEQKLAALQEEIKDKSFWKLKL